MEESEAQHKVFNLPELVERVISFLDPEAALHLVQSQVTNKEILQKSLSSKAWNTSVTRMKQSLSVEDGGLQTEDALNLVKIFKLADLQEHLQDFSSFLLNLICKSSPDKSGWVEMICPCNPNPHTISLAAFHLLEEVEGVLGRTQMSVKSMTVVELKEPLLSAISSRMSRQPKMLTFIAVQRVVINSKSSALAFITLLQLQAKRVEVNCLEVGEEVGEEGWQLLATALIHCKPNLTIFHVLISRQDLARRSDIKDISNSANLKDGFEICDTSIDDMTLNVNKSYLDSEPVWTEG